MITDFLKTKNGRIFISIIWGIGLACIFRKVCVGRDCLVYKAPHPETIKEKIYGHNKKCYKFRTEVTECKEDAISQ